MVMKGPKLPKYGRAARFKKRFQQRVCADISACLRGWAPVGATILICAAIDCLARYFSGNVEHAGTKQRYLQFLQRYFPSYDDADSFYSFVRSGLVHAYNMEGQVLILGSDAEWARKLHLRYDAKHQAIIINPFVLYTDLKKALNSYIDDLDNDKSIRRRFDKVWSRLPFEKQQLKSVKFEHMKEASDTAC